MGTNYDEISIKISIKKTHLQMTSAKRRPFCSGFTVLNAVCPVYSTHVSAMFMPCVCDGTTDNSIFSTDICRAL